MVRSRLERRFLAAAAILLSVLMIFLLPAQKIAAAEEQPKPVYVSEVRLGYGKTAEEAVKSLEGYEILKNGGKYADLNEGSGKDTVVLFGYKTTENRGEAITDIAAMNMKGGYSFTEYKLLMDKYRDSQITPFLRRFMVTVQEYRDNYNGTNENNKAKARYACDMLNLFIDDDTGMKMGDLLLKETAEELGKDKYEALSDEDKKKYGSLTTILMQGETSTVFMIEQLVTMAADTNENTWLQRLESVTADSLLKEYMKDGAGETDAKEAMARDFENSARLFAEKWPYFRDSLMEYEKSLTTEDGGIEVDPTNTPVPEEDEEDENEEGNASFDQAVSSLTGEDAVETVIAVSEVEKATANAVDNIKLAASYNHLKNTKYGSGTMYDYFTQTQEEIEKDNYFALYPLVSVLTAGQIAGIDFMNLNQLVQYGMAIENSYEEMNKDLGNYIKSNTAVSVFEGVNRELYDEGTALTDAEMREKAATSTQLFGDSQSAAIGRAGIFAAIGIASGFGAIYSISKVKQAIGGISGVEPITSAIKLTQEDADTLNDLFEAIEGNKQYIKSTDLKIGTPEQRYFTRLKNLKYVIKNYRYDTDFDGRAIIEIKFEEPPSGSGMDSNLEKRTVEYVMPEGVAVDTEKTLEQNADDIYEAVTAGNSGAKSVGIQWGAVLKAGVGTIFSIVFLGLTVYSIYSSVMEIYDYYNVDMTKVPKYIVDRADLVTTDENGNSVIRRNESAYYEAVMSNRPKSDKNYEMMKEYGDVNAGQGKQWLVLYTNRSLSLNTPVLADSLTVVTGKNDMPDGFSKGIHLFGESIAVNMTEKKYTYEDKLKGIFVYFKNEPAATTAAGTNADTQKADGEAPATSSALGAGYLALVGIGCLIGGVVLGIVVMSLARKRKEAGSGKKA